jgi:uncharacterized metal-binding protein YceD (DUF177 family)
VTGVQTCALPISKQRAALASLAEIVDVPKFSARITLQKKSPTEFQLACQFSADIIQSCVVSLEPVPAHIERDFIRALHYSPSLRRPADKKEVILTPVEDDEPDEIESLHYDLAGPLMEEFLLAIDPYPRAPGVAFAPPGEGDGAPANPFAVLKDLKSRG